MPIGDKKIKSEYIVSFITGDVFLCAAFVVKVVRVSFFDFTWSGYVIKV